MKSALLKMFLVGILSTSMFACATPSFTIGPPASSQLQYDIAETEEATIQVVDQRTDKQFFRGLAGLQNLNIPLQNVVDPIDWFSKALQEEFASRGISATVHANSSEKADGLVLTVNQYQIVNYRVSGFSPWVSYHLFDGELTSGDREFPVQAYFLYGKVPMMSIYEIEEPCLTTPMAILVKDVASKINRLALHNQIKSENLDQIFKQATEKASAETVVTSEVYPPIMELGGANNPDAMAMLVQLVDHKDTFVRACALSAMGALGAEAQLDFLKEKYSQYADIDRFMALKAIGDIGTPEAIEFVKAAGADPNNEGEYGVYYCVRLYAYE